MAANDICAGTIAGIAQVAVGHPLDTIKVRLQTGDGHFRSVGDCLRRTVAREGVAGLYKGAASPLAGAMLMNASAFFFFGLSKAAIAGGDRGRESLSARELFAAGLLSGAACLFVETPIDLVKTKLQVQRTDPSRSRFRSVWHCARHIYGRYGIQGLYQGTWANALRFVPGRAVYMSSFEVFNRSIQRRARERRSRAARARGADGARAEGAALTFAAGAGAGCAAWISTYPFDVIRNRIMADDVDPSRRRFRGVADCARQTVARGGGRALFDGLGACLLRAGPVNGAIFLVYKECLSVLEARMSC
jgi:solute carrier family 25 carnitine/acylcarnitine transporter 20/29